MLNLDGVTTIGFDADDTLWHNESFFKLTQERFRNLLMDHVPEADVDGRLYTTEVRNLKLFGYGVKGFTLSMIETAIELTAGRIPAYDIEQILDWGKEMLDYPIELLPGADEVTAELRRRYTLLLITKGDLFDQESKIARSGLAERFHAIEIVSEKDVQTYQDVLARHRVQPDQFLMIGNSLRSDVLPVLEAGGRALHVPYELTWKHEQVGDETKAAAPMLQSLNDLLLLRIDQD